MEKHDLEAKVDSDKLRKEVLRQFSYFGAAVNKHTEINPSTGKPAFNAGAAIPYISYACDKASEKASGILKYYLKGIKFGVMQGDSHTVGAYAGIFEEEFANTKYSDICSLVKERGYKGKLPEYMEAFADESMRSLSDKYKGKINSKKAKLVLGTYGMLHNTLYRKTDDGFADYMLGMQFSQMNDDYNKLTKKGKKSKKKSKK